VLFPIIACEPPRRKVRELCIRACAAAHRRADRRSGTGPTAHRPRSRKVVRQRRACPSSRLCRYVGRSNLDDHRRRQADNTGCQSPHLDQTNGLSRTGLPALVSRFYLAARRSLSGLEAVATRRLVAFSDRERSGSGARADCADVRRWAGSPRTAAPQADHAHRQWVAPVGVKIVLGEKSAPLQRHRLELWTVRRVLDLVASFSYFRSQRVGSRKLAAAAGFFSALD
jgi:hypothetical protein